METTRSFPARREIVSAVTPISLDTLWSAPLSPTTYSRSIRPLIFQVKSPRIEMGFTPHPSLALQLGSKYIHVSRRQNQNGSWKEVSHVTRPVQASAVEVFGDYETPTEQDCGGRLPCCHRFMNPAHIPKTNMQTDMQTGVLFLLPHQESNSLSSNRSPINPGSLPALKGPNMSYRSLAIETIAIPVEYARSGPNPCFPTCLSAGGGQDGRQLPLVFPSFCWLMLKTTIHVYPVDISISL